MTERNSRTDPESDGGERRGHARHTVAGVSGTFQFSTDGRILNLSLDGMALETSAYLQVGRSYLLKLEQNEEELQLRGRVVWCRMVRTDRNRQGDVAPVYAAGVHFEDQLSETARELHHFLGRNAVISLEKRLFGRFRLHEAESANLDYQASYRVEKISLAGMEIRSNAFVEADSVLDLEIRIGSSVCTVRGRVVHSQRLQEDEETTPVLMGIEFLGMTEATEQAIKDLIRTAIQ